MCVRTYMFVCVMYGKSLVLCVFLYICIVRVCVMYGRGLVLCEFLYIYVCVLFLGRA